MTKILTRFADHHRAALRPVVALAFAAVAINNGCSKPPCEETLTCPRPAGATDTAGAGGSGGTKTTGTGGSSAAGESGGDPGSEAQQGGAAGTNPTGGQGGTSHQALGGEGGMPRDPCEDGSCTTSGSCIPAKRRCDSGSGLPQLCSEAGEWENEPRCGTEQVCAGGACVCGAEFTTCGDECVTVEDNPKHCGRCGHDCLGGECIGGKCQPYELASAQVYPTRLAVDATHAYWIDRTGGANSIRRKRKRGGDVEIVQTDPGMPGGLVVAEGRIYWDAHSDAVTTAGIYQCEADGTNRVKFADASLTVAALSLSNGVLFWNQTTAEGKVSFFSKPLNSDADPTPLASDGDVGSNQLTAAGDCLFYRTAGAANGFYLKEWCDGHSFDYRFSTAKSFVLPDNASADSTNLYFGAEGGLMRLAISGTTNATILVPGRKVTDVAVDGDQIYYIEGDNGAAQNCTSNWTIYRTASVAGSTPVSIVPPPQECASNLATDAEAVYWMNSTSSGTINLIAK